MTKMRLTWLRGFWGLWQISTMGSFAIYWIAIYFTPLILTYLNPYRPSIRLTPAPPPTQPTLQLPPPLLLPRLPTNVEDLKI